ncbi:MULTISPECIES: glycosyltransferase family 4 protein [Citricoccus]|uniref:glycosyltransferase family 4 protein n=1 Tax=Citricoccus TaxID=169133 RepID=UPI000255F4C2|nr:glycosyltransferase family 4 protein [Citricoccus sp. CH26A]
MTSRPRIAILGLNYAPEHTGIAPYTTGLATGLRQQGIAVRVFTAHPHYPEWRLREGSAWTSHEYLNDVPVTRLLHYVPTSPKGIKRLISEIAFGLRLLFAGMEQPDVYIAVSPALFSSAIASLRIPKEKKFVIWVQDIYSLGVSETGGNGTVAKIISKLESKVFKRADRVVVIHERFASYLTNVLDVPNERISVIPNWTHLRDLPTPPRGHTRASHGWGPNEAIILHTGNMGLKQGLENVIEAARLAEEQHAPIRFVLVGDGSERERLARLAKDVRNCDILPPLDDAQFAAALSAADILLVNEKAGVSEMAVPSKLTSYFSAGRPIVAATDPNGVTAEEVKAAKAGLVVTAGDPQALLDAVMSMSANAGQSEQLGRNGRSYREAVLSAESAIQKFTAVVTGMSKDSMSRP